jgi:type IV pilus assembly protein PilY1
MDSKTPTPQRLRSALIQGLCAALPLLWAAPAAQAQLTDIASNPLTTSAPNQVKPNLLFILDDSGSMARDYMPDDVSRFAANDYGRHASQCNGLAYNPQTTYRRPVDSTGADRPAGTYTFPSGNDLNNVRSVISTAPTIGTGSFTLTLSGGSSGSYWNGMTVTLFSNTGDTTNRMIGTVTAWNSSTDVISVNVTATQGSGTLTSPRIGDGDNRPFYYTYNSTTGGQAALDYTYNSSGVITTTTFFTQCDSADGTLPTIFSKVVVTPDTITQNYRNWYTYYRTRMLMAQSATSLAFNSIGDRFRVGFTTISSTRVSGTNFLDVADFNATHKASFHTNLWGASSGGFTPLRGALSKAGRYFAKKGKLAGSSDQDQVYDPVQFSCQKNFAILTTDGYWNTDDEVSGSTYTSYGPDRLDRTAVGQQDGLAERPMYDGASVIGTVSTPMQQLQHWYRTRTRTQVTTEQYYEYRIRTSSCSSGQRVQRRTVQRTQTATQTETSYWARTKTYDSVVTITNGVASAPAEQNVSYSGYTPEGTTDPGTWTNGSWTSWNAGSWADFGTCQASPTTPSPNPSTTTSSTGSASAWSGYSGYIAATPATDAAVATGPAVNGPTTTSGGSQDSLADIAMYYYSTDLRDAAAPLNNCTSSYTDPVTGSVSTTNVCANNVPPRGSDTATHQHMSTFTVGMGVNGTLRYSPNYLSGGSADYEAIKYGPNNWPIPGGSAGAENIDDLWHAAVNGRGQYFNAGDPASLASGLSTALAQIDAQTGSGSGAAASTLQPVAGDNSIFIAKYTTVNWTGELVSRAIDPQTGAIATVDSWSAEQVLDARVAAGTARNIIFMQPTVGANTGTTLPFTYTNLATAGYGGHFTGACTKAVPLSQCANSGYNQAAANDGDAMVSFLRGNDNPSLYRDRVHVLGDIVGGAPVYVRRPPFQYTENNYAAFVAANSARTGVVYVAANDGMLHAFDGNTGAELWAYVPSMVMDRMYRLADNDYANRHEFFVNGAPVVGDIYVGGSWKTILVGGLGAGGRGYFALDITNPNSPQVLWEFKNDSLGGADNLGLTFGNPVITKRTDGTWVVAFTSGYNNVSPGDGNGRLFVVNANTGERLVTIATETSAGVPAGTAATPSGLGKLNVWVDSTIDNTARRYYAGDLRGNLWRFDIDSLVAPNGAALRLAYLQAGGVAQPITTQPALGIVDYAGTEVPVVYVGTGRLLGLSDLSTTSVQSVYAIKDPLTNTPLGDVHSSSNLVTQVLTEAGTNLPRTVTNNAVDWSTRDGWRVDFIGVGERVNVDMQVIFQTLNVATNTPNNDACTAGGSSYLYHFNVGTGSAPLGSTNGEVGTWLGGTLVVGMSYLTLQGADGTAGTGRTITVIVDNRGVPRTDDVPPPPPPPASGRRTSWRELVQ